MLTVACFLRFSVSTSRPTTGHCVSRRCSNEPLVGLVGLAWLMLRKVGDGEEKTITMAFMGGDFLFRLCFLRALSAPNEMSGVHYLCPPLPTFFLNLRRWCFPTAYAKDQPTHTRRGEESCC
jgi:hypothetical protein